MKNIYRLFASILCILVLTINVKSQSSRSPQSVALSGAYATSARSWNTIGWNPANLGFSNNPSFSMGNTLIPFLVPINNVNVEFKNNALSLSRVHNTVFTGADFENHKNKFLGYLPSSGWQISPSVSMNLLSMSFSNWAFSYSFETLNNIQIPKGLFKFLLYGNELGEDNNINLDGLDLETQTVGKFTLYHGRKLNIENLNDLFGNKIDLKNYIQKLYVGGGIKFLQGGTYGNIENFTASLTTDTTQVDLTGKGVANVGTGGLGWAMDLGATAQINEKMKGSLSLHNLFGSISWGKIGPDLEIEDMKGKIFTRKYEINSTVKSSNFEDADSLLEEGVQTDTTLAKDNLTSNYPAYMNIGFEYQLKENLTLLSTYRQYFSNDLIFNSTPLLSIGSEYYPFSVLPLRAGLALGGHDNFRWSLGSGLELQNYCVNFGFAQIGGFFNHSRGFTFSFSSEIRF